MAEFIEKQAAIDALGEEPENWIDAEFDLGTQDQWRWDVKAIKAVPAADVRPVVRGRWLLDSDPGEPWKYKCNQCGEVTNNTCMGKPRYNYCPMCGAYMSESDA